MYTLQHGQVSFERPAAWLQNDVGCARVSGTTRVITDGKCGAVLVVPHVPQYHCVLAARSCLPDRTIKTFTP